MKIENEKIVEATDQELFQHYLNEGLFLLMGYDSYKAQCVLCGTKIIDENKKPEVEIKLQKRYYSAFQVMEAVNQVCPEEWLKIVERLGKAETNDVESVVRCQNCRYHYNLRGDQNKTTCYCDVIDMYVKRDHYCADGEPMKETKNETERYI